MGILAEKIMKLYSLDTAIKYVDGRIAHYDHQITTGTKRIVRLKEQKEQFQKIQTQYPDASYRNGEIYLVGRTDKWGDVAGMGIEIEYNYAQQKRYVSVKFSLKNKDDGGIKTYIVPANSNIAEIKSSNYSRYRATNSANNDGTIQIFDYKNIIPDECKRKKSFLKRIKKFILKQITGDKLTIVKGSSYEDDFTKLIVIQ